jgi:quercetin dioxygenase-like cupin family protein
MRDLEANVPRGRKSAVLRVRRLAAKRLAFMLGAEDDTLREFAEEPLRITLVALKKGTALPSHHVEGPISIQTLRGCLKLTTEKGDMDVPAGSLIALGPGVVHTAKAHEDCAILLTFAMP